MAYFLTIIIKFVLNDIFVTSKASLCVTLCPESVTHYLNGSLNSVFIFHCLGIEACFLLHQFFYHTTHTIPNKALLYQNAKER